MSNRLDEAKRELVERAHDVAVRSKSASPAGTPYFLQRYYRHVAPEDLIGRDPVDIFGAAAAHFALAEHRPMGTAIVRAFTPTVESHGWASSHTVVEIATDDMPFLVDTVTMELTRQERGIHLIIHPQVNVIRDLAGVITSLVQIEDGDGTEAAPGVVEESWIHVEIDRETSPDDLRAIEEGLHRVLRDVREAVEDWPRLRHTALTMADELASRPPVGIEIDEVSEAEELLHWLADDHFTFLGYREYLLESMDGEDILRAVTGSGLGILRSDAAVSLSFSKLRADVRAKAHEKRLLVITKANSRSTVHRPVYLDYIGFKTFDANGEVIGERRFLGLLSSSAYNESVMRIPVLRRKVRGVLELSGFKPGSHSAKDLQQVLETYPRDGLFQARVEELLPIAVSVVSLQERRQLRLFVRADDYGRYLSCLLYLPRDRYNTDVRIKMQEILLQATGGETIDYTARVSESVLARLHFVIRMPSGVQLPELDTEDLEARLSAATRSWGDDFSDALVELVGEEEGARLQRRYEEGFTEAFKEDFLPRAAAADVRRMEELPSIDGLAMNLYQPLSATPNERRFKIYRCGSPISLTEVLPVLSRMGVEVVDEWPYEVSPKGGPAISIYDFGLRWSGETDVSDAEGSKERFQEGFESVWRGRAESDGLNALMLRAGLTWRQVTVLRALGKYLRQAGTPFSQAYIEECLVTNHGVASSLVHLFETRCDPDQFVDDYPARQAAAGVHEADIAQALDQVASLDQDRILRSFLSLVRAILRTNYFQVDAAGEPKSYTSFKFDARSITELPQPKPRFEIWVHSPRVEGVHLRFGRVARGGLRWSDRREDFRTEILGLVKAQAVKNAVIVPVGAKGGFVAKKLPDQATAGREAWLAEGIESYKTFIRGLLDVTDNRMLDGSVAAPPRVVCHDPADTYLVVAADKGTATFSDIANSVSLDYGFWLGDAFASGGSAGYDHKVMGITARGAWESVKRHFREMGRDSQTEDFTAVGIGDMSGDVFGNGMLLSEHIRLVAAFDHRDIFLDPDPVSATSFAERARLFALPRSSWQDYNSDLISEGGGIYPRTAKSIPVSAQVRAVLGIEEGLDSLTPAALMRAIVTAPVDLLWNGGIGTYVKSSAEAHLDVGDKANDAIRVDGVDLRCAAVGEGGNLGFTQLGRIEYALRGGPRDATNPGVTHGMGGRINTDAIDNSAGVDTSDHEVNIKILLDRVVSAGDLTNKQRNEVLASMTDEVAGLVLRHNYDQNTALATANLNSASLLHVHASYMRSLESRQLLDRPLEFLPTDRQLNERHSAGLGLTSPELSVLLAYTKNTLFEELVESTLPDDAYLQRLLTGYFPQYLQQTYPHAIAGHPLSREIITNVVINSMVNDGGITFIYRLSMETGATVEELGRAHIVAQQVFDLHRLVDDIAALDTLVDAKVQTRMRIEAKTLVERGTRWLAINRRPPMDIAWQIEFFTSPVSRVTDALPELLLGQDRHTFLERLARYTAAGVPEDLATRVAVLPSAYAALHIVENAVGTGTDLIEVTRVTVALNERLGLSRLLDRIIALPRNDRWQTMARAALRDDLHSTQAALVAQVLASTIEGGTAADRIAQWESQDSTVVARSRTTLNDIVEAETADLARLSVGLRVVRSLLRSSAATAGPVS